MMGIGGTFWQIKKGTNEDEKNRKGSGQHGQNNGQPKWMRDFLMG